MEQCRKYRPRGPRVERKRATRNAGPLTGNLAASVQLLSEALIKVYYRTHSFMREAFVFRIHPELLVGHLDEGLRGQDPRKRQGRQKTSDDHGFNW